MDEISQRRSGHSIQRKDNHRNFVYYIKIKEICQNKNSALNSPVGATRLLGYRLCLERTSSRKGRMRG